MKSESKIRNMLVKFVSFSAIFVLTFFNFGFAFADDVQIGGTVLPSCNESLGSESANVSESSNPTATLTPGPTVIQDNANNGSPSDQKSCASNEEQTNLESDESNVQDDGKNDSDSIEMDKKAEESSNTYEENKSAHEIDTGNNSAGYNDGNGLVGSGDVNGAVGMANSIDSNIAGPVKTDVINTENTTGNLGILDLFDKSSGISASNNDTGENSENEALAELLNKIIINDASEISVENNLPIYINTGNNTASYNDGDGTVVSGDVNLAANVWNIIDSIFLGDVTLGVLNIFRDFAGDIVLPENLLNALGSGGIVAVFDASNNDTGDFSLNTANTNVDNNIGVVKSSENNISNNFPLNINTGNNKAGYNDGSGTIETGGIKVKSNTISVVGAFFDGEKWFMILINVLGDWAGDLFGGKENTALIGGTFGEITTGNSDSANTAVNALNTETGENSSNNAETNIENDVRLNNQNKNSISNNMPININTGGNKASYNDGNGTVISGSVDVILNFINFVRSNITADSISLIVLNIFGNWDGSVRYGGKKVVEINAPVVTSTQNPVTENVTIYKNSSGYNVNAPVGVGYESYPSLNNLKWSEYWDGNNENYTDENPGENVDKSDKDVRALTSNSFHNAGGSEFEGRGADIKNSTEGSSGSINFNDVAKALIFVSVVLMVAGINYQRKYNQIHKRKGVKK